MSNDHVTGNLNGNIHRKVDRLRDRARQISLHALLLSLVLPLAACGRTTMPGPVARLEVSPAGMLLTGVGQSRALTVHAFDAAGVEIAHPSLTFASSRPEQIAVGSDGVVTANVAAGSAMIAVGSADVQAPPLFVAAATPADGVLTVPDEHVVHAPVPLAPAPNADDQAPPQLQVRLSGIGLPAPGTLLVGTGAQPIAGRVVSAAAVGDQADVVFEVVPVASLFQQVSLDLDFPAEQTARWLQTGTPDSSTSAARTGALTFLDSGCSGNISRSLLTINHSLSVNPSLAIGLHYSMDHGTVRSFHVGARGTLEVSGKVSAQLSIAVTGSIECSVMLAAIVVPITGPLSLVIAPLIPIYGKVKLSVAVATDLFSLSAELNNTATLAMGIDYDPAHGVRNTYDGSIETKPKYEIDYLKAGTPRVTATAFMGLGSGLAFGNLLGRFDVIDVSAGPELEVRFGGVYDVAQDTGYQSGFGAKAKLSIGPGKALKEAMNVLFDNDLVSLSAGLSSSIPLATSATPTLVSIDKDSFAVGDDVTFKVQLNPSTTGFAGIGYNVKELRIYRLQNGFMGEASLVASTEAAPGQTDFELHWTADVAGNATDTTTSPGNVLPNFYAMYVDRLLSIVTTSYPFELGPATRAAPPALFRLAGTGTGMMAIGDDGVLRAMGQNNGGALGTGDDIGATLTSPGVVSNSTGVVSVTGSAWFGAMLLRNGSVWAWGWGAALGIDHTNNPVPFQLSGPDPSDPVISISSGYKSTAMVFRSGLVYRFGDAGKRSFSDTRAGTIAAAEGYSHTAILTSEGQVYVWGDNSYGQLGSGAPDTPAATSALVPGLPFIVSIAAGDHFTLALAKDGTVWAWGYNGDGALGLGYTSTSAPPTQIPNLANIRKISAGEAHALALSAAGSVYGWGQNSHCELGTAAGGNPGSPTTIFSGATDIDGAEFSSLFASGGVVWRLGQTGGFDTACTPTATVIPATSH